MVLMLLRGPNLEETARNPEPAPDPMRRLQGDFFIFLGVAHCLLMIYASLYSLGKFHGFIMSPKRWHNLYFSYFLYMYVGSIVMIIRQYFKTEVFIPQALLDLLAGVLPFQLLFWVVRRILLRWGFSPWISLLPGLFLVYYGLKLRRGRALWRRLELD
jgi:hypothetical protein